MRARASHKIGKQSVIVAMAFLTTVLTGWSAVANSSVPRCQTALINLVDPVVFLTSDSPTVDFLKEPSGLSHPIRQRGPFGLPMAMRRGGGVSAVFGSKKAVERARPDAGELREPLFDVTLPGGKDQVVYGEGDNQVTNLLIPSIAGSAVTTRKVGDFDAEMLVISRYKGFQKKDFFQPRSRLIGALESTIKSLLLENAKKGFVFSDFKAGEFDFVPEEAQATHSRAIKWSESEILKGFKMIPEGSAQGPLRKLTLRQALASQSRIKVDWLGRVKTNEDFFRRTGIRFRYMEFSLLISLAGQRPGGIVVLRANQSTEFPELGATGGYIAVDGRASEIPVRPTTIFFKAEHMELARQASVATPGLDVRHFNTMTVNTVKAHLAQKNYFKLMRVLYTRLHYWNDVAHFLSEMKKQREELHPARLVRELEQINSDSEIRFLYVFLESAKAMQEMFLRLPAPTNQLLKDQRALLKQVNSLSESRGDRKVISDLPAAIEYLKNQMNVRTWLLVEKSAELKSYLDYVLRLPYAKSFETYDVRSSFLSFSISSGYRSLYSRKFNRWTKDFPEVKFTLPEDLHMTVAFFGEVAVNRKPQLISLTAELNQVLLRTPFALQGGELQIVGKNNSQLAIVFNVEKMPLAVRQAIEAYKVKVYEILGVQPEARDLRDFLPHISVAHIKDVLGSNVGGELIGRLAEENLGKLRMIEFNEVARLFYVNPESANQPMQPRYTRWEGQ